MKLSAVSAEKIIPVSYWVLATAGIIWGDFIKTACWEEVSLQALRCIGGTVACLTDAGILIGAILKARGEKLWFPCALILVIGLAVPFICGDIGLRPEFCMFVIVMSVCGYLFAVYYEDITQTSSDSLSLVHHRYLEYSKSSMWLIAFVLIGYFYWELRGLPATEPTVQHIIASFLQLVASVAGGLVLVVYGLNRRLHQLEAMLEHKTVR